MLDRVLTLVALLMTLAVAGCAPENASLPPDAAGGSTSSAAAGVSVEDDPAGDQPSEPAADLPPESGDQVAAATEPSGDDPPREGRRPEKLIADGETSAPSGELFVGWPRPDLVLVVSGEMNGYIEPCGCAGLENQKGGLSRRHTFLKELADKGWESARLDLGGLVQRFGLQTEIKFHSTIDALRTMSYDAVAWGPNDLRLPADELVADAAGEQSPFVSANIDLLGVMPRFRVIERGGRKLGITAILGDEYQRRVNNDLIALTPAATALAEVVPQMKDQCDYLVLLSHASKSESGELAKKFPDFDLIVTAGGADEPPAQPKRIEGGKTLLLEVGTKGMYLGVIGLFNDEKRPFRFQLVPLDKRFKDSAEMGRIMAGYQDQLRELGWAGLQVNAIRHPSGHGFVGSQRCGECHTKAFAVWESTPHAHATDTLVQLDIPRQFDAECVSCHATGWAPQRFVPFQTGYTSLEATPLLAGNGCENCHGPGSAHVAAETGETDVSDDERDQLRQQLAMRLDDDEAKATVIETCRACHDQDNSPEFEHKGFDEYWSHVEHKGKD